MELHKIIDFCSTTILSNRIYYTPGNFQIESGKVRAWKCSLADFQEWKFPHFFIVGLKSDNFFVWSKWIYLSVCDTGTTATSNYLYNIIFQYFNITPFPWSCILFWFSSLCPTAFKFPCWKEEFQTYQISSIMGKQKKN